jgi:uncharacterized protein (DUF2236 family)
VRGTLSKEATGRSNRASNDAQDGYFPRGRSMLRRVHEERAVGLLYGQRALCVGAIKPLNYVGTSEHTHSKLNPFRRITHTAAMFETVFFGGREQADKVLDAVNQMHQRVVGELPQDAGPHYPAGTPYSAFDPQLMLWTVAVIADSAQWFYENLVRPLSDVERDELWLDYLRFAEMFGMPREDAPATYEDFREWYDQQLCGADLHLTEEARYMGYASAFEIPLPSSQRLPKYLHDLVMLGSLPPPVRDLYGLTYSSAQARGCSTALMVGRLANRLTPSSLRYGSCARHFAVVAATERRRIELGQPTPQLAP